MMKNILFPLALLALPLTAFADYVITLPVSNVNITNLSTPETEPQALELPVIEDPTVCSNTFTTPVMAPGFPKVTKGPNYIQYAVLYTNVGGYSNKVDFFLQQYPKILLTHVTGTQHGENYAAYSNTPTVWQVNPGETIHLTVTPSSYDLAGNVICASGTPIDVVNATYETLRAQ